ncbi:uncharacterized protein LOC128554864 isoform X2 [Mercenaria mercenaria]|nr:uncharacterized protein LOC128554864 isoform X2 [Mercenaria mercenaria]
MAAKQTLAQDTENMETGAVFSVQNGNNNVTDDNVPLCEDLKSAGNTQVSEEEWERISKLTAVESCLQVFEDKGKVVKAIKVIKMNKGHFPADIKANDIAVIITEMEKADYNTSQMDSAIAEIFDKGHQGIGIPHELHIAYQCKSCEQEGVKPVIKFQKKEEK